MKINTTREQGKEGIKNFIKLTKTEEQEDILKEVKGGIKE